MRLVKLLVDEEQRDTVLEVLDEETVDVVVTRDDRSDADRYLVEFPLPTQGVEYVLDRLRDAGVDDSRYTVIASGETAKTTNYHELEERFVASEEEDDSVAPEEIRAKALDLYRRPMTYHTMTALSAVVAAAGLLLNSPAVVVGAMVIAPQVGSAMMTSVGMVIDDRRMVTLGLRSQVTGLSLAVVAAIALGYLLRSGAVVTAVLDVSTVSQISKRISPGLLSVSVALCAGGAGALGLATALPVSLVGVMIAAAIVPAAAAVGIGVAWGLPSVALGAGLLLVVNTAAVNLAGAGILWGLGYHPADDTGDGAGPGNGEHSQGRSRRTRLAMVALVAVLLVTGGVITAQVGFENDVNQATTNVFEEPAYGQLEVTSVQPELLTVRRVGGTPEVLIHVTRPDGVSYPALPGRLERAIEERSGVDVDVVIEYTDRVRSR